MPAYHNIVGFSSNKTVTVKCHYLRFQGFVPGVFCGYLYPLGRASTCIITLCEVTTSSHCYITGTLNSPSTLIAPTGHNAVRDFKLDAGRKT
jgi:hypothetical protein